MYSNNRDAYRQTFYDAWLKYKQNANLTEVEKEIVTVILDHPEYQFLMNKPPLLRQEFALEENPFFHFSLHLAIREQVRTDRPAGIQTIYQRLLLQFDHVLEIEHGMMQVLSNFMQISQRQGIAMDEQVYLQQLREKFAIKEFRV